MAEPSSERGGEGKRLLVYGATGHTGKLVAAELHARGIAATLAGRNARKLKEVAEASGGLPTEAVDLKDRDALDAILSQHAAVLHIAGPFTVTGPPMAEACLRKGVHYLDITGETEYVRWLSSLDKEASDKGIMLMPCVGYDTVPGDCLGAYVKEKLPSATHLDLLTFVVQKPAQPGGGMALPSHGTLKSVALHILPNGGLVKRAGALVKETIGKSYRTFFLGGDNPPMGGLSFPAAELPCLHHSTGIPNITVFLPGPQLMVWPFWLIGLVGPRFMNWAPIRFIIESLISLLPQPDESKTKDVRMLGAAEARDASTGESVRAVVSVDSGYPFTARAAVEIASRVLAGNFKAGFQTPAAMYGSRLVLEVPGNNHLIDVPL